MLLILEENDNFAVKGYDATSLQQDLKIQTDLLRELFLRKQALLAELKNYNTASLTTPGIPVSC